jgi:hypothetical protein
MANPAGHPDTLLANRPPMPNYRHGLQAKSHPPLTVEQLAEVEEIMA